MTSVISTDKLAETYQSLIRQYEMMMQCKGLKGFSKIPKSQNDEINRNSIDTIKHYLNNRDELLKKHAGYYVFVSPTKILPTNKKSIDIDGDYTTNTTKKILGIAGEHGEFFKVGNEIESSGHGLYGSVLGTNQLPVLPISFGIKSKNVWCNLKSAFVDTGLDVTTFHPKYFQEIKAAFPDYINSTSQINVIGGVNTIKTGYLDITFCDNDYQAKIVWFAIIPYDVMIGRDLLTGNFQYDAGKLVSFTRH